MPSTTTTDNPLLPASSSTAGQRGLGQAREPRRQRPVSPAYDPATDNVVQPARTRASPTRCRTAASSQTFKRGHRRTASCRRSVVGRAPRTYSRAPGAVEPGAGRLVHPGGAGRADRQARGLEQDRADGQLRRERRLLRPPAAALGAVARRRGGARRQDHAGATPRWPSSTSPIRRPPRSTSDRRRHAVRPGPARADVRGSRRGAAAAGSTRRSSTTPRRCASWRSASASRSPTSAPIAARCAAT